MTKLLFTLFFILCTNLLTHAQESLGFNWQSVIREPGDQGIPMVNQPIELGFSIVDGENVTLYSETHSETTNSFGLVNVVIGKGTAQSGDFEDIEWGQPDLFLFISVDGETTSKQQFQIVPRSKKATDMVLSDLKDVSGAENPSSGQVLKYENGQWRPAVDENTIQTITKDENKLILSNGGGEVTITSTEYLAGEGIQISGNTIINQGDLDGSDDLLKENVFGGDVIGTYDNLRLKSNTVGSEVIQNGSISSEDLGSLGAQEGQVLKFSSGRWEPRNDLKGISVPEGAASVERPVSLVWDSSLGAVRLGKSFNPDGTTKAGDGLPAGPSQIGDNVLVYRVVEKDTLIGGVLRDTIIGDYKFIRFNPSLEEVIIQKVIDSLDNREDFIAQEVVEIFPELVSSIEKEGMYMIGYEKFGVIAIQAIKEQQEIIEKQDNRISLQDIRIAQQEKKIQELMEKLEQLEQLVAE